MMSRISVDDHMKSAENRVQHLHQMLHHVGKQRLAEAIKVGLFQDWRISVDDVLNSNIDKCLACKLGKGDLRKTKNTSFEYKKRGEEPKMGERVHVDLVFISRDENKRSHIYLLGVEEARNYLTLMKLKDKSAKTVAAGLRAVKGFYEVHGHQVKSFNADHDSSIAALQIDLLQEGVEIIQTSAGRHDKKVESQVRHIRAAMRATLNSLGYKLPKHLMHKLFESVVQSKNKWSIYNQRIILQDFTCKILYSMRDI